MTLPVALALASLAINAATLALLAVLYRRLP